VGEVGLPAFVGLFGGESDIGRFGTFLRLGGDQAGRVQVAVDRVDRHGQAVVVGQVPGDGLRPLVEAFAGQFVAQTDDQIDRGLRQPGGAGVRAPRAGVEGGLALGAVAGYQPRDPALGDPLLPGHRRLAAALDDDSGDNQASFRHPPNVGPSTHSDDLRHAIRMS
jgi:hypothetical protein